MKELKARSFAKSREKDVRDLSLLISYTVQVRGGAIHREMMTILKDEMGCKVRPELVSHVLELLKDKDVLAANQRGDEWVYKMKRLNFNCNVEVAHVTRMLPTLQDDPSGIAIMAMLENAAHNGSKKKEDRFPKDWHQFKLTFKLTDKITGGAVIDGNNHLLELYENGEHKPFDLAAMDPKQRQTTLIFERDDQGNFMINRACVRGMFKHVLSMAGKAPKWNLPHIGIRPIRFKPGNSVTSCKYPVQRNEEHSKGGGAGFSWMEVVRPGQVMELTEDAELYDGEITVIKRSLRSRKSKPKK